MRHALLGALTAAVAALAVLAACSPTASTPEPVRAVRTQTVAEQTASGSSEYSAEVRARTESRLGFRVGGKMLRRLVDPGNTVRAGQVLAELDPQDLRLGRDAARASVAAAQVNQDQAQADFLRYKDLRDQGFIGAAELERRQSTLKAAQAQLAQAQAEANMQGNQAGYATLVADAPGVITGVDAEPGMVVAAGAPVVRLAHDGPRDVVFSVPEDQVDSLRSVATVPGRIKVRLWGASGDPLPATIREISAAADASTRTFQVKADLGNADPRAIRLGQTATVLIELPRTSGIVKLPFSALREEQGKTQVWLVDKQQMTVHSQPVQVSGAEGNQAVISSGLAPGQIVVTAGVHVLSAGQKVKFYVDPSAPAGSAPAANPVTVK